jgi:hypothetical protein
MKTPLLSVLGVLNVGAVCMGATPQDNGQQAVVGPLCIKLPGTPVQPAQLDNIIKRLQQDKYPQNFKVHVWNNGATTQTIGKMSIDPAEMKETDRYAKSIGLTALTIRIGCPMETKGTCSPSTSACPPTVDDLNHLIDKIRKDLK